MFTNRIQQTVSGIISFFMMICISLLVLFIVLESTVFNIEFVTGRMNDHYYETVLSSLNKTLKDEIAPPSGIPDEVFDQLFNLYLIKEDSQASVRSILANIDYSYDSSRVRKQVMDKFTEYANQNNISMSDTNLETLAGFCVQEYERQISIPILKSFAPLRILFDHLFTYVLLGMSVLLIALTVFQFKIHRFKHRALRYSVYCLFASSLMIVPIPLFLLIQGSYRKANISPDHVKLLFVSVINSSLAALLVSGLIIAAMGFALLPVVSNMRRKAMKIED